jgi:hypothetical protein
MVSRLLPRSLSIYYLRDLLTRVAAEGDRPHVAHATCATYATALVNAGALGWTGAPTGRA